MGSSTQEPSARTSRMDTYPPITRQIYAHARQALPSGPPRARGTYITQVWVPSSRQRGEALHPEDMTSAVCEVHWAPRFTRTGFSGWQCLHPIEA